MMRKKATYGKTMKAKSGKKLTAKAAKKRSVRNKAGKKAVAKSKKMGYGGKAASMVPPKSKMKKAKAGLKTPKPSQKGLKKLPTAVRNKMGYAKKGKTVKKAGYGKKTMKAKVGTKVKKKKCKYGCK